MQPGVPTLTTILLYASVGFVVLLVVSAIAAPLIAPFDPVAQDLDARLVGPAEGGHPLGTDDFGRDVASRLIYGSRSTLVVGFTSVGIALAFGLVIGLASGLSEGLIDSALMLLMDAVLSFPTVLLAVTVVSVFGYGIMQVMMAVGVIFTPVFARLVRAETLAVKAEEYVEASRALGSPLRRTISMHILPNVLPKIIVQASITFALAIVIEASLSFLGLGTQPPNPSWGLMLKDARNYLLRAPWLALYPGIAVALTVLSLNIIADALSERFSATSRAKQRPYFRAR
ncbi:MAG: ABC transporter permease subunit [Spirochaetes bacterium]|nr:ABC transporter permease subunit [Spirochaetota bacterium]